MSQIRRNRYRLARRAALVVALLTTLLHGSESAAVSTVNFWLSNTDTGPAAPVIYVMPGAVAELKVWARPPTDYVLSAFSLNLVAEPEGAVSFTGIEVDNPELEGMAETHRHQLVFDSTAGLFVEDNQILGFSGFSAFTEGGLDAGSGIGPNCGIDPQCSTVSGNPSWQIATVAYESGMSLGSTEFFLEIGTQGVWQSPANAPTPDPPTDTNAVFGLEDDTVHVWDVGIGEDHRGTHFGLPDAVIRVATADFDQDGDVDGADFLSWQEGLGVGATLAEGDADGNGLVDGDDEAAWKFQYGTQDSPVAADVAVPEPNLPTVLAAPLFFRRTQRLQRKKYSGQEPN
jgi:hypothetical protein